MIHEVEELVGNALADKNTRKERVLSGSLRELDFSAIRDLFASNEAASPSVLWNPSPFDILHPKVKSFAGAMWSSNTKAMSKEDLFSQIESLPTEPYTMILEPVVGRVDFRYLKYGAEIAAMYGRNLTGHCTSEIGGHISEFFIALYSAVLDRKECVLSVHVPPSGVFATVWRRFIFPVIDQTGEVHLIAAINVPDNELCAGLEALPDPALVANEDGQLMFANLTARRLFGEPTLPRQHISTYCDIKLELPEYAADCAKAQSIEVSQTIGSLRQLVVHFELRTSATFFKGDPYYVVQLKPY